jgi:hypothetical protein
VKNYFDADNNNLQRAGLRPFSGQSTCTVLHLRESGPDLDLPGEEIADTCSRNEGSEATSTQPPSSAILPAVSSSAVSSSSTTSSTTSKASTTTSVALQKPSSSSTSQATVTVTTTMPAVTITVTKTVRSGRATARV